MTYLLSFLLKDGKPKIRKKQRWLKCVNIIAIEIVLIGDEGKRFRLPMQLHETTNDQTTCDSSVVVVITHSYLRNTKEKSYIFMQLNSRETFKYFSHFNDVISRQDENNLIDRS